VPLGLAAAAALMPGVAFSAFPGEPPAPDRELKVPVSGGSIHVRVNGPLDGPRPPLLTVHGGPGGSHAALLPALPLAHERAVILYDQLDSGLSERPGNPANWVVARFASEIDAIRAALGLDRVHLLGHSWGGTVALEYAARRPPGLASIILQGPLISTRAWMEDAAALRALLPADVQATLDACEGATPPPRDRCDAATEAFYARFWRLRPPPAWQTAYEKAYNQALNHAVYEAMWGLNEFRATGSLADYDGEALLARIAAPALFLLGDSDEIRPDTARRFAAATGSGAEVAIVPDAAHRIQSDQPGLYVAAIDRWLRRHDA